MPHIKRILLKNACYHLIVRGNQKQKVFSSKEDCIVYLSLLKKFKHKYSFRLYAYCLMPNHVHLLGEIDNLGFLSCFMHDLNRTYTLYFNKKYNKVGHLWQGRFRSKIIAKDKYLLDCITYIEYNPLRANIVKTLQEYPWNSYLARALGKDDKVLDSLSIE